MSTTSSGSSPPTMSNRSKSSNSNRSNNSSDLITSTNKESSKSQEVDYQMEITKLTQILDNPLYTVFNSDCVRKKTNWSKLARKYKFDNPEFDPDELLADLPVVSPKLNKLLNVIDELDKSDMRNHGRLFKHFIFSDIKGFQGAKVITSSLIAKGLNLAYGVKRGSSKIDLTSTKQLLSTRSKNFYLLSSVGVFDQPISVSKKKEILANFNSRPDNVYGDIARFIVMDSGFKEGIDLFDIKYIHIFEPQSTSADQKQVIGRGTRTCGQKGLVFHPTMGWPLYVFNYDMEINERFQKNFNLAKSAFDLYLKTLNIDLRLFNFLNELESTVILGSVDYELNSNIHNFTISNLKADDVGSSVYSSARTIDSLKSADLKINGSSAYSSSARTIDSLKSADLKLNGGSNSSEYSSGRSIRSSDFGMEDEYIGDNRDGVKFPSDTVGHKELRKFIRKYFSNHSWNDVKMENQCGYAGPSFEKGKLLPKPSFTKKSASITTVTDSIEPPPSSNGNISLSNSRLSDLTLPYTLTLPSTADPDVIPIPLSPESIISNKDTLTGNSGAPIYLMPNQTTYPKEIKIYDTLPPSRLNTPSSSRSGGGGGGGGGGIGDLIFGGASSIVNLSPSQAFIKSYFTPENPYKGVLLNWSVGTGKTCAAIATATSSFENAGYTILWVTRTTLKNDIWKNMFDQVCSDKIREIIENAETTGKSIPADQTERMRLLSESWSIRPMSYKQFSNLVSKRNNFYKSLVNKNGTRDPLHKTLLIIDEAHKLYGGNDLSSLERPDMNALHKALMNSYIVSGADSVRVLLMTATPITVNPMELIKLLNLCKTPEQQMPEGFSEFAEQFSLTEEGTFSQQGKTRFLDEIAGHISYLNREKDARQFAQPIIEQVVVPLVQDGEMRELVEKYDLPGSEDPESEEYKAVSNLEKDLEKQSKTLNEWESVSKKANFKKLVAKCDGLQKDIKKDCIKTLNEHIGEIIDTAKSESATLKEEIKRIKDELKEMNLLKKTKIRNIRESIKNAGDDYNKFKDSTYYNLKNVCGKKVRDIKTLTNVTEELPEIIQINTLINELDDQIKQLQTEFKNKIDSFKTHIAVLKDELRKPGMSSEEKKEIKVHIENEERRTGQETKREEQHIKEVTKQLAKTKKSYETDKKKIIQKLKGTYKKNLVKNKKELNKTLKLKQSLDNLEVERETEQLKTLIADKKSKIAEDIERFFIKHRQSEALKEAENRDKQIYNEKLKEEKAKLAEEKAKLAEEKAKLAEEKKAKLAEEKAKLAEKKAKLAEEKAKLAEEKRIKKEEDKKQNIDKKNKTRKINQKS